MRPVSTDRLCSGNHNVIQETPNIIDLRLAPLLQLQEWFGRFDVKLAPGLLFTEYQGMFARYLSDVHVSNSAF